MPSSRSPPGPWARSCQTPQAAWAASCRSCEPESVQQGQHSRSRDCPRCTHSPPSHTPRTEKRTGCTPPRCTSAALRCKHPPATCTGCTPRCCTWTLQCCTHRPGSYTGCTPRSDTWSVHRCRPGAASQTRQIPSAAPPRSCGRCHAGTPTGPGWQCHRKRSAGPLIQAQARLAYFPYPVKSFVILFLSSTRGQGLLHLLAHLVHPCANSRSCLGGIA